MAPRAWLKRVRSAPGKTKNIMPSWRIERSRCSGRVSISARSSASARTNPWTGSRMESMRPAGMRIKSESIVLGGDGEVAIRPQQLDELRAAAQDAGDLGGAVRERQRQQHDLARRRPVEPSGCSVDQLLERRFDELLQRAAR